MMMTLFPDNGKSLSIILRMFLDLLLVMEIIAHFN